MMRKKLLMKQQEFNFTASCPDMLTIKQASEWASQYLNKNVTTSNFTNHFSFERK